MYNSDDIRPIIIIEMDGGLIHNIAGNIEADIIFVDSDIEGLDDKEVSKLDGEKVWLNLRNIDTKFYSYKYLKKVLEKTKLSI